jgi:hypothetical protein
MVCPYSFGCVQLSVVAGAPNGRDRSNAKPDTEVGTTRAALRRLLDHAARLGPRVDLGSRVNKTLTPAERRVSSLANRELEPRPRTGSRSISAAPGRGGVPPGWAHDAGGPVAWAKICHVAAKAHAATRLERRGTVAASASCRVARVLRHLRPGPVPRPQPVGFQPDGDATQCAASWFLPASGRRTLSWPARGNPKWHVSRHWPDFSS